MSRPASTRSAVRIGCDWSCHRLDDTPQARRVDRTGARRRCLLPRPRADRDDEGLRRVVAEVTLAPLAAGKDEIEPELVVGVVTSFRISVGRDWLRLQARKALRRKRKARRLQRTAVERNDTVEEPDDDCAKGLQRVAEPDLDGTVGGVVGRLQRETRAWRPSAPV